MAVTNNAWLNHHIQLMKLCVLMGVLIFCTIETGAVKIRYASTVDCDRFSLDAVYYERFKVITENIFKDSIEFVSRVAELVADSLTSTMAKLPNRDASDNQERNLHVQFRNIKKAFSSKVKKIQKNITSSWEALVADHFDLMYDNDKSSLAQYLNKTLNMTGAYSEARKNLDLHMGSFIHFIKTIVRDGIQGISLAADGSLKQEASEKNSTKENADKEDDPKEKLMKKKIEITEMVVSGFLKKVTLEVIKQKIDLFKKITIKPEDRDSVLDDILFDILMIKNRILALIHSDIPNDKGSIDLARRSVYTYWLEQAEKMYEEKIKFKKSSSPGGDSYYKKLWSDEKELIETLLNLMEVYP